MQDWYTLSNWSARPSSLPSALSKSMSITARQVSSSGSRVAAQSTLHPTPAHLAFGLSLLSKQHTASSACILTGRVVQSHDPRLGMTSCAVQAAAPASSATKESRMAGRFIALVYGGVRVGR